MKKISTITFHSSYNYGSNLQAYALQEYVKKLCNYDCNYSIINYRKKEQKDMYKSCFEKSGIKNKIKRILLFKQKDKLKQKQLSFEDFINRKLNVTKEYSNICEIEDNILNSDYFISGSDQLWNIRAIDFDWAYFLEFVKNGKKISYSASFGPKKINFSDSEFNRIKKDLSLYDMLSVREEGSLKVVKDIIDDEPEINIDPTLLLTKEEWQQIIPRSQIIKHDYILLYNLKDDYKINKLARKISKILKLPVVVTLYSGRNELFSGFERHYETGPIEFLNLVENASLVLSSSFHGTIFSIIFEKPFFAINGLEDYRINTLLNKLNLSNRTIESNNIYEKCQEIYNIKFDIAKQRLNNEKEKARKYLIKALEIGD